MGRHFLQEYSNVLIEGGNPPDVPGINYTLIRGKKAYDFCVPEEHGRTRRRSKFGTFKGSAVNKDNVLVKYQQEKERFTKERDLNLIRLTPKELRYQRYKLFLEKKRIAQVIRDNKKKILDLINANTKNKD